MASKLQTPLDNDVREAAVTRGIARAKGDKSDSWAAGYRGTAAHYGLTLPQFKDRVDEYSTANQAEIVKAVLSRTGLSLKP